MKPQSLFFILLVTFSFSQTLFAATVMKIKGEKALVKMAVGEFKKGDTLTIYDNDNEAVGKARVYKTRGIKAYVKVTSGFVEKGYRISGETENWSSNENRNTSRGQSAARGYLGLSFVDGLSDSPITFAGDYMFSKSLLGGVLQNWNLLGGLLYWTNDIGGVSVSILEIGAGLETQLTQINKINISAGFRGGIARAEAAVSTIIGRVSASDTNLFVSGHVNAMYPINDQLQVGGEFRLPYYLDDNYDFFDIYYLLGSVQYNF